MFSMLFLHYTPNLFEPTLRASSAVKAYKTHCIIFKYISMAVGQDQELESSVNTFANTQASSKGINTSHITGPTATRVTKKSRHGVFSVSPVCVCFCFVVLSPFSFPHLPLPRCVLVAVVCHWQQKDRPEPHQTHQLPLHNPGLRFTSVPDCSRLLLLTGSFPFIIQ